MNNEILQGIAAWIFPGAGHAMRGQWNHAIIIAFVVWTMFLIAVLGGGAYYPNLEWDESRLLVLLNVFARMGNLLGAVVSWMISATPFANVSELATFEYAGRFLEIAGILNLLAVADLFIVRETKE
ncbi:MAG: DUF6677 family protein [Pyrinomonadaceae bacterium]